MTTTTPAAATADKQDRESRQFEYAEWALTVKDNPAPMLKLIKQLEETSVGRRLEAARRLLDEHAAAGA